jgi:inhibitor of KinA sporulation pathway (predicted exonuclease)
MKNLLIIDLESTCFIRGQEPKNFKSEIIEIGAVVLDTTTFTILEEYQCLVKPVLFSKLSDFCKSLTTISQEEVESGISIQQAMSEVESLFKRHNAVFSSWGKYDKNQFKRVCETFRLNYPFDYHHISLKHDHGDFYKKRPMGMDGALSMHGLTLTGTHHRGLDDAKNIAKIAEVMIKDGWKHESLK